MKKLKIGVLARNYNVLPRSISPKQAYEVHKRMPPNVEIIVVTNDPFLKTKQPISKVDGFKVYTLNTSSLGMLFKRQVAEIFTEENVDIISAYVGMLGACILSKTFAACQKPVIFNIYKARPDLRDFLSLRASDLPKNYKRIFDFHNTISAFIPNFFIKRRLGAKHVGKICVPGGRVDRCLKPLFNHVEIVPNGVDIRAFSPSYEKARENQSVLFFGRASALRGIDTLIDAFVHVNAILPKAKLQLCMLGGAFTDQQRFAADAIGKLGMNVEIIGARDDIHKLIKAADAVALPFRFAGEIPEYPLTLLEAMAAGKPVITTPIGSINDVIVDGKNGILVPPKCSPNELANAIIKVLTNRDFASKLGKNARKSVESHDWDLVSKQMFTIYNSIENINKSEAKLHG